MAIRKPGLALLVAFVSVFGLSQTASAASCSAQIEALKAALNDGHCAYGKRKRCRGLNRKLDKVVKKLEKGRYRRAARKLSNFGMIVENMATRRKNRRMHMSNFQALLEPYRQVAACIAADGIVAEADPAPEPTTPTEPDPQQDIYNE